MVAPHQLSFIGQNVSVLHKHPSKVLLTSWIPIKRAVGRPITMNKNAIVRCLKNFYECANCDGMDDVGTLQIWLCDAMDRQYRKSLIKKLQYPERTVPCNQIKIKLTAVGNAIPTSYTPPPTLHRNNPHCYSPPPREQHGKHRSPPEQPFERDYIIENVGSHFTTL